MKTPPLLPLLAFCLYAAPAPLCAAEGQGLSKQMSERIESQLESLGKVQNAVLNSYAPDANPEKEGCEAEQATEDTYKPR